MNPAPQTASSDAVAELSCRPLRSMFVAFRKLKSEDELRASLQRAGVTLPLSFLEDVNNWTSFALSQRILDQLSIDSGVPDFPRRAGLTLCTPEVLGFAFSAVKAFGTPRLVYQRVVDLTAQLNRVGALTVLSLSDNQLRVEYRAKIQEPNHAFCEVRQGNLQCVPSIWGQEPAKLTELSCQARGDSCCSYILDWQNPAAYRATTLGVIGGALLGAALQSTGVIEAPLFATGIAGAAFAGIVGALLDSRRALRERDKLLERQKTDLLEGVKSLTDRYEQIIELNRTLEQKVDERTAELASARDKLQAALATAVALDRAKTQFFTNISHELRTPLTLILAPLETAMQEWSDAPADTRSQLQMMHRNGLRLLDNINQLLDLSRLDAGKTRLKLEEFDAPEMLRQLIRGVAGPGQAARHRAHLRAVGRGQPDLGRSRQAGEGGAQPDRQRAQVHPSHPGPAARLGQGALRPRGRAVRVRRLRQRNRHSARAARHHLRALLAGLGRRRPRVRRLGHRPRAREGAGRVPHGRDLGQVD